MAVQPADKLDDDVVEEVLTLAHAAADADGAFPLAEHVVLRLRHGSDLPVVHLLARDDGGHLVGYAHLDTTDPIEGAVAELVVHPRARRRGLGHALVQEAVAMATTRDPQGRLRLWAHGDHPAAGALAASHGFTRTRVLRRLRRSLSTPLPEPSLPPGIRIRPFRPGQDDAAWLALNARAFADHPEQGRWTLADLRARIAEPWFDPAGFLLADADGALVGFHWTKIHNGGGADRQHTPIGEVYVLGVDPAAHGQGLGAALTLAGLHHLRDRGLDQAMLYVDDENRAAVALYTGLGFTGWSVDVTYTLCTTPATRSDRQRPHIDL
jgi:mycothiol synthase